VRGSGIVVTRRNPSRGVGTKPQPFLGTVEQTPDGGSKRRCIAGWRQQPCSSIGHDGRNAARATGDNR